jgi:hypothetical protein
MGLEAAEELGERWENWYWCWLEAVGWGPGERVSGGEEAPEEKDVLGVGSCCTRTVKGFCALAWLQSLLESKKGILSSLTPE